MKPSESVRITDQSRPGGVGFVAARPGLSGGVAARVAASTSSLSTLTALLRCAISAHAGA